MLFVKLMGFCLTGLGIWLESMALSLAKAKAKAKAKSLSLSLSLSGGNAVKILPIKGKLCSHTT